MRQIDFHLPEALDKQFDVLVNAYTLDDKEAIKMGAAVGNRGWLEFEEFLTIAKWKSARPTPRYEENSKEGVIEVSKCAFSAAHDLERIVILTELAGVRVRTATAILHLCFPQRFPMLDIWTVAAMGIPREQSEKWDDVDWLRAWLDYAKICRDYALKSGHDLRSIDRALWAYAERAGSKRLPREANSSES
ncbi:MAG: hypothetical protein ABSH08_14575 [Tepidisphaeraceae bacterium]